MGYVFELGNRETFPLSNDDFPRVLCNGLLYVCRVGSMCREN